MNFDNLENLDENQIIDLYNDVLTEADDMIAACSYSFPGYKCSGGWWVYCYCDGYGSSSQGHCNPSPVRCK